MTEKTMNKNLERLPTWIIKLEEIIERNGIGDPKRCSNEKYRRAGT